MQVTRINKGIYQIRTEGRVYEAEDINGKGDWNLYEMVRGRRDWINDFPTLKACKAEAAQLPTYTAPTPEPVHEITAASATTAGSINDQATGNVRAVIRQFGKVIWIEPTHSASRKQAYAKARAQLAAIAPPVGPVATETEIVHENYEYKFTYGGQSVTVAPDFKGTHGWRWYIDNPSTGLSIRSDRAYLCHERAIFEAKLHINQQACAEAPEPVTALGDAIRPGQTNYFAWSEACRKEGK
jgi:hypothetical protein